MYRTYWILWKIRFSVYRKLLSSLGRNHKGISDTTLIIHALIFPIICISFYPTHLSPISFFLHTQLLMVKHLLARNVWMSCPSSLSGIPSVPPSQGYPCLFQAESLFSQEQTMGQSVDGIYTFFMRINLYFPLLYCFLWLTDPGCLIDRHWLFNRPT